jgi:PhzF family phenazine biosynthesis protein
MSIEIAILQAFTDKGEGGNPAAVVLDADELNTAQRLDVARRLGLSETAFVSRSDAADFRLEFFTPNRLIAHCGHATIAVFSWLVQQGRITGAVSSKETIDGTRSIFIDDDTIFMEQLAPKYKEIPREELRTEILPSLGLTTEALDERHPAPEYVNTGNGFLIMQLRDRDSLATLRPDMDAISTISERHDLIGFYPFVLDAAGSEFDTEARMFAPRYGIPEEAATGMAAGPLASWLHDRARSQLGHSRTTLRVRQGSLMSPPSPSRIEVRLDVAGGSIQRLTAGGTATLRETRSLDC